MHAILVVLFWLGMTVRHSAPGYVGPQAYTPVSMVRTLHEAGVPTEWADDMYAIAKCESGFQPRVLGDHGQAYGLFQLHELWFRYFNVPDEQRLDPVENTRTAVKVAEYEVARGQPPFSPWTCQP